MAAAVVAAVVSGGAHALPTYFTESAVLPGGLAALAAERELFRAASAGGGVSLSTESFELISAGTAIDFGPFTATLLGGAGFSQISGNSLITTDGNSVLSFSRLLISPSGVVSVLFSFDAPINAFGIDLTSIDETGTTVSFLDDLGNVLNNFAGTGSLGGATFFGVYNSQPFSTVRFDFLASASEILNFDYLQFGVAGKVPEPASLALVGVGIAGLAAWRRRPERQGPRTQ